MTAQRTARIAVAGSDAAHRFEIVETPAAENAPAPVNVFGIPENELTPRVRDALARLMSEADALRWEMRTTQFRLAEAEHSADRDHLLPLLNRRAFKRELTRAIGLTARYGTPASLIYFDLDEFKRVNDAFGHPGGDAVLTHFAETLLAHVRDSDVVARLGGDEFGVILAHNDQEQAEAKAAALASNLFASPALWNSRQIDICFSWGVFELGPGDTADTAIARADAAMYARKKRGPFGPTI